MDATERRAALDALTRGVWQATKDWPTRAPRLMAALEAGFQGANIGVDVDAALVELEAAWAEAQPPTAPPLEAAPADEPEDGA